ncbi:hypothetical protein [Glutamicibacter protophormiae]
MDRIVHDTIWVGTGGFTMRRRIRGPSANHGL